MMNEYTFTTETGWRVHEYRPFSISYAVRDTPGLSRYGRKQESDTTDGGTLESAAADTGPDGQSEDLLATLTRDKLKFDALSWDIIRQMVEERVLLRDKNRKDIMGRITDVSGDISCCYTLNTPDSLKTKAALDKTKLDLERQAREEDLSLWKDLTDLRKELLINQRQYQSTRMRQDLVKNVPPHDGDKEERHPVGSGYVQRD